MVARPRLIPPIYFATALAGMMVLNRWIPVTTVMPRQVAWAGFALWAAGFTCSFWGGTELYLAGTPLRPFEHSTALVTHGIYRISRNPIYLGLVVFLTGSALVMGTATPLLGPPVLVITLQRGFIRHEEEALEETFGGEYRRYKEQVRRWI